MQQFSYKMQQLLQNPTILLQNATVITNAMFMTKCVSTATFNVLSTITKGR